jgi:uncharacterized protein YdbL (DUF1318 family)
MDTMRARILAGLVMVGFFAAMSFGCAAVKHEHAMTTERLLAAAGFKMKMADTPEKMAHLKELTQRELVPHQKDGKVMYVYADAEFCQCVYVGTEAAYQRYQQLALQKQMSDDQRFAAEMNADAAMNWSMWGPWHGPWY